MNYISRFLRTLLLSEIKVFYNKKQTFLVKIQDANLNVFTKGVSQLLTVNTLLINLHLLLFITDILFFHTFALDKLNNK